MLNFYFFFLGPYRLLLHRGCLPHSPRFTPPPTTLVPGVLAIGASLSPFFARFMSAQTPFKFTLPWVGEVSLTYSDLIGGAVGVGVATHYVTTRHYVANNLIGVAFCLQGVERTSLGSYAVGALLLGGLFFYDIYWVFFTPVMVGVAKSIDGPIKLLFPRSLATADTDMTFSMLGLGDIVLPGIFIALLLRYDAHRAKVDRDAHHADRPDFPKTMFNATLFAYTLGLVTTLTVMLKFQHAQPALLYLVPACLGASLVAAPFTGGFKQLFAYSEDNSEAGDAAADANADADGDADADGAAADPPQRRPSSGGFDDDAGADADAADDDAAANNNSDDGGSTKRHANVVEHVTDAASALPDPDTLPPLPASPPVSTGSTGRARRRRRRET